MSADGRDSSRSSSKSSGVAADAAASFTVKVHPRIADIPAAEWDACAGGDNPFLCHAFLEALESSGSATAETGWLPQHLALEEDGGGRLLGVAPLYLKSHSYGEYVFDWGWANAYERAGGRYYPKLQCAVPFTPATGPRLLVRADAPDPDAVAQGLTAAMVELAQRHKASSVHVTFPTRGEWERLGEAGFLLRQGQQFHWENHAYRSFDDFLNELASRKRKQIRRERRDATADGALVIRALTGRDIEPRHWDAFFRFYRQTSSRKWGSAYLTRRFFDLIGERMADRIVLMMAERTADKRLVAGALNLIGRDALYGRNWGAVVDVPFLHFEMCYYQAIDFAIERGLARVEAGAQGQHKIARGYLPTPVYSSHWIADPALRTPVSRFLDHERAAMTEEMEWLEEAYSPFRHADPEGGTP